MAAVLPAPLVDRGITFTLLGESVTLSNLIQRVCAFFGDRLFLFLGFLFIPLLASLLTRVSLIGCYAIASCCLLALKIAKFLFNRYTLDPFENLCETIAQGNYQEARLLIRDADRHDIDLSRQTSEGQTFFMLVVGSGDIALVRELLQRQYAEPPFRTLMGQHHRLIREALDMGHTAVLRFLIFGYLDDRFSIPPPAFLRTPAFVTYIEELADQLGLPFVRVVLSCYDAEEARPVLAAVLDSHQNLLISLLQSAVNRGDAGVVSEILKYAIPFERGERLLSRHISFVELNGFLTQATQEGRTGLVEVFLNFSDLPIFTESVLVQVEEATHTNQRGLLLRYRRYHEQLAYIKNLRFLLHSIRSNGDATMSFVNVFRQSMEIFQIQTELLEALDHLDVERQERLRLIQNQDGALFLRSLIHTYHSQLPEEMRMHFQLLLDERHPEIFQLLAALSIRSLLKQRGCYTRYNVPYFMQERLRELDALRTSYRQLSIIDRERVDRSLLTLESSNSSNTTPQPSSSVDVALLFWREAAACAMGLIQGNGDFSTAVCTALVVG